MPRQRLLTGSMTLLALLQQRRRRQVAVYFSMVRRSAAWACRLKRSTSMSSTTLNTLQLHAMIQVNHSCADYGICQNEELTCLWFGVPRLAGL